MERKEHRSPGYGAKVCTVYYYGKQIVKDIPVFGKAMLNKLFADTLAPLLYSVTPSLKMAIPRYPDFSVQVALPEAVSITSRSSRSAAL